MERVKAAVEPSAAPVAPEKPAGVTLRDVVRQGLPRGRVVAKNVGHAVSHGASTLPGMEAEKVEETERTEETAGAVVSAPVVSPEQNTDTESKIRRAQNLLKRAGWQDPDFEHFSRDQILRRAQIQEKASNREAALRSEIASLRKQLREPDLRGQGQGSSPSTNGATQSGVAAPSVDVGDLARQLAEGDGEIEARLKAQLSSTFGPVMDRLAQLERRDRERSAESVTVADAARRDAQAKLSEVFPQLANDDDFEEFSRTVEFLKRMPQYARHAEDEDVSESLLRAAARALDIEEVGERVESTPAQSVSGRGFMEQKASGVRREGIVVDDKAAFMQRVNQNLARLATG